MSIPYVNLGGEGPIFHFSHANGYPPLAYRALLQAFQADHEVIASLHRPIWDTPPEPSEMKSWRPLGEDLLLLLKQLGRPNISVGHSMGAAAIVMAAVKHPELFRSIVLIEPVIMSRRYFY
ncbi:MAG TPA: alpha/beta hydrolase, partial [Gammaproteobacteria bacterium]|nr:alpha/beta hydrolase [Gammaproteobacteria bacterium]